MARTGRRVRGSWRGVLLAAVLVVAACSDAGGEPDLTDSGAADRAEPSVVAGFDGSTIRVGILVPSSGPSAEAPADRAVGVKAYLDYVNTELGGIGGRYAVQVDVVDSSDLDTLGSAYRELRDRTVLLAQVQGRDAVQALAASFEADRVLAGVSPADLEWVQAPTLLQTGAPQQVVGANALAWLVADLADEAPDARLCSAVQPGSGSDGWQEGVDRAAARLGVEVAPTVSVPAVPGTPAALQAPLDRLRAAGCDAVFLGTGSAGTTALLAAADGLDFAPTWVAPAGWVGGVLVEEGLEDYVAEHLVVVGDGPTADPPAGLRELLRIHEGYAPGEIATPAFAAGYRLGKAVVAVLDAAVSGGDLSREGILAAAARLRSVRLDELAPDAVYGPPERRRPELRVGIARPDAEEPTRLRWVDLEFSAEVAAEVATG